MNKQLNDNNSVMVSWWFRKCKIYLCFFYFTLSGYCYDIIGFSEVDAFFWPTWIYCQQAHNNYTRSLYIYIVKLSDVFPAGSSSNPTLY